MSAILPFAARCDLDDFDRLREVLCVFRATILRELPTANDEQREGCNLALDDLIERFDSAVQSAHHAAARWRAGEIGDAALCVVTAEPRRIGEEAMTAVWSAATQ